MILEGTVYREYDTIKIPCFTTEEIRRIHTLLGILEKRRRYSAESKRYEQKIALRDSSLHCEYCTFNNDNDITYAVDENKKFLFKAKYVFSSEGEYYTVSTFHDGPWLDQLFKEYESENPFSPSSF